MPRLTGDMESHGITGSNFSFSGVSLKKLGATEYTLATIAVDTTGSTAGFADDLRKALVTSVDSLKKSPRAANLLIRAVTFNSVESVKEIHGFKLLSEIDTASYPVFHPDGTTPLCDACFSAIGAMEQYGKDLKDNDYNTNGIAIVITDGGDNSSKTTPSMTKDKIALIRRDESLESIIFLVIGINAVDYKQVLDRFVQDSGADRYIDIGDATPQKIAKLAGFVSQSVSSQSQAMGTGSASQSIPSI